MPSLSKKVLKLIGMLLILIGVGFSFILFKRFLLPYNKVGNYFDVYKGIVYKSQSMLGYAILTLLFLGVGIMILFRQLNNKNK